MKNTVQTIAVTVGGFLGWAILRAIHATTLPWKIIGVEGEERYWISGPPRVLAFWHSQQLVTPFCNLVCRKRGDRRPRVAALISAHRDGRLIAKAVDFLGIASVAGSSTRGGREALFEMAEAIKDRGLHVAITPDGPRGPVHKVKGGAVRLAQRTQVPIFPLAVAARDKWVFKSWDRMFLPKPFSPVVKVVGDLIHVPAELSDEEFRYYCDLLEQTLNRLTERAEEEVEKQVVRSSFGQESHAAR